MADITLRGGLNRPLTNDEVDDNFTNLNNDKLESTDLSVSTGAASGGGTLSYSAGVFTFAPADLSSYVVDLSSFTTTDLAEGTNLYYTNERVDDRVNTLIQAGLGITTSYDDINNELTIESDTIEELCKNATASTILKGTPVYQTGTSGNAMEIAPADASSAATMPAVGVLGEDLTAGSEGSLILMGRISGIDTSAFNEGDVIYVASGGGYTDTRPTGQSVLVQNLGRVTKVNASNGGGVVMGAGRSNDVPNLTDGNVFIGNASGTYDKRAIVAADISDLTATATELNYTDGVTSSIQTQLDSKAPLASPTFTGTVIIPDATVTGDVSFGDNDKAQFGNGNDLSIYHNGTQSIIEDQGTGGLLIKGSANLQLRSSADEVYINCVENAQVSLKYNNNTKLDTTSTGIDVTGSIVVSGTVDGRDVAADGTKLDGIETGATADQTASEILTAINTVDGAGSGLDADLLDGQQGSYYTTYTDTAIANLVDSAPATLDTLNELAAALGDDPNFATTVTNSIATKLPSASYTAADVLTKIKTVDGAGSGLDADLLDGQQGSYYAAASSLSSYLPLAGGTMTGTLDLGTQNIAVDNQKGFVNSGGWTRNATPYGYIDFGPNNTTWAHIYTNRPNFYFNKNLYVLGSRVFHDTYHPNADKLTTARTINGVSFDGSANITVADATKLPLSGGTLTGDVVTSGDISAGSGSGSVSLTANDGDGNANVTFNHRNGDAEQAGNVGRIEVNVDSFSGATMDFEVRSNSSAGAITINNYGMTLTQNSLTINNSGTSGGGTLNAGTVNATTFSGALSGNATTATDLANIPTTFNGTYPMTVNVSGKIYSHPSVTFTGSTGTLTATTFSGALSGNATTATTLQTARTINGVSFDGSANITVADSTKLPLTGGTLSGDLTVNGGQVFTGTSQNRVKLSVWSTTAYGIGMQNGYTYGGLANEYALTNQTNTTAGRGFWWGNSGHTNAQGAMALTNDGLLTVSSGMRLGYGQSDTTAPTSGQLDVNGTVNATTFSGALSGNATTATTLQTARTINGVSFDGSANINIAAQVGVGSLTKTFAVGETATISLTDSVLAPSVTVLKEVSGDSVTSNAWEVNATTQNYDRQDFSYDTTLEFDSVIENQNGEWTQRSRQFNFTSGQTARLVFKYQKGTSYTGDIQLDYIQVAGNTYDFESDSESFQTGTASTATYSTVSWATVASTATNGRWVRDSGGTGSTGTGLVDAFSGSYYVYAETSGGSNNDYFWLRSPEFTTSSLMDISFAEARLGSTIGILQVYLDIGGTLTELEFGDYTGKFKLGSGSFAASDVGKVIEVNNGLFFLTSTDGSYYELEVADNYQRADSGEWGMFGIYYDKKNRGLSNIDGMVGLFDLANCSTGTTSSASISANTSIPVAIAFADQGRKLFTLGNGNDTVQEYNVSSPYGTSFTYVQSFSVSLQENNPYGLTISEDGRRMYIVGRQSDQVKQYRLNTPFSLTSVTYESLFPVSSQEANPAGLEFNDDGTKLFVVGITSDRLNEYRLQVPWNISSAYFHQAITLPANATNPLGLCFGENGHKLFVLADPDMIYQFYLKNAYDISNIRQQKTFQVSVNDSNPTDIAVSDDGRYIFMIGTNYSTVRRYQMSDFFSTQVTSQYRTAAITKAPIDTSNWTDINSTFATNTNKNNTSDDIFYAFSNDGRTTWKVISSAGERSIARNNSGTWQINNASAYDQESWSNVSDNTEFDALESAMIYSSNQLTSDELNALIDPNQITVADSLDLAIVFDTDSVSFSASQYSQGVAINYSAAAINKGAIHGIDYEYDAPAQDEVRITSLTGGNLKIRVI